MQPRVLTRCSSSYVSLIYAVCLAQLRHMSRSIMQCGSLNCLVVGCNLVYATGALNVSLWCLVYVAHLRLGAASWMLLPLLCLWCIVYVAHLMFGAASWMPLPHLCRKSESLPEVLSSKGLRLAPLPLVFSQSTDTRSAPSCIGTGPCSWW